MAGVVTLTTDFGLSDGYVGVMKGVMLRINRQACLVDITHQIKPQNIAQAAYVLSSVVGYFPEGTTHLCVVDPGVGSSRRAIAFSAGGQMFVGPDNGIFTTIFNGLSHDGIHEITNPDVILKDVSSTFHGRDIFAPTAGYLSRGGLSIGDLGPEVDVPTMLTLPVCAQSAQNQVGGAIIYIDHFGNAVTNITSGLLEKVGREVNSMSMELELPVTVINGLLSGYSEAPDDNAICATIGSWNTVELFVKDGSAAKNYGLKLNDPVEIRFY